MQCAGQQKQTVDAPVAKCTGFSLPWGPTASLSLTCLPGSSLSSGSRLLTNHPAPLPHHPQQSNAAPRTKLDSRAVRLLHNGLYNPFPSTVTLEGSLELLPL